MIKYSQINYLMYRKEPTMLKQNSSELLIQAMYDLLKKKNIDKIKVAELIEHSGVSKATFYRLYYDKYELRNACYKSAIDAFNESLKDDNWNVILQSYFEYFYENHKFLLNGISSSPSDSIIDYIVAFTQDFFEQQICSRKRKNVSDLSRRDRYVSRFYAAGCTEILMTWLKNDLNIPSRLIAEELFEFMPEELKEIFPAS